MATSPGQQILDTIPTLKDWQNRLLVQLLRLLRWMPATSGIKTEVDGDSAIAKDHNHALTPEQRAAVTRLQQRIREVVPEGESLSEES